MKSFLAFLVILIGLATNANAQAYTFYINSGQFVSSSGWSDKGYSGKKVNDDGYDYRNRSQQTQAKNLGSIPTGTYYIVGVTSNIGPNTIVLSTDPANDMYGRNGFRIHGNNQSNNASQGCIILGSRTRERIVADYNRLKNRGEYLTLYVYE